MSFFTQAASIIFKRPFAQKVGKLEIDIVNQREISEKTTITSNPVERRFNTDNVRKEPTEISFTATISAFSLKNSVISQISSLAKGKIPNRLKEAHDELYRLRDDEEPITLVMKYKTYDNMMISDLRFSDDAGDGEVLRFVIAFKEIKIATSQMVSVSNLLIGTDNAKKVSSFGRQVGGTKTAAPAVSPSNLTFGQFVNTLF